MSEAQYENIRQVVADTLGLDVNEVGPGASVESIAAWSSLAHLRVLANLERIFATQFSTSEMTSMTSIPAIAHVLSAKSER